MTRKPEQWGEEYQTLRPRCELFTHELKLLLSHLIDKADLDVQLEGRTKEVKSFVEKIFRKNEKYEDPLSEITDKCGLRVICYYLEDVSRVGELIDQEFSIDWANSERQGVDSDPDRFGYRSDHYVVEMTPPRSELPEWVAHCDLKAEIQVRTVMQHAWASVDHKIRYKRRDLPRELQRRLSRLSALLETADEQFTAIQKDSQQLAHGYEESFAGGDFDFDLDVLSLRGYVRSTEQDIRWMQRALEVGYERDQFIADYLAHPDQLVDSIDWSRLIEALREANCGSITAVNDFFEETDVWGGQALQSIQTASSKAGFVPYAMPNDVLTFLSLYSAGNLAAVDRTSYQPPLQAGLKAAIREGKRETKT